MNKKLPFILRLIVGVGIIFVIFKFVPYNDIIGIWKGSKKSYIVLSFFIFFATSYIAMLRWRFLLSSLGLDITLREAFYSFFSSNFFNLFFPSLVAGDVFRGLSISSRYGKVKEVTSSVFIDRLSGGLALVIVALFSFFIGRKLLPVYDVLYPILIMSIIFGFIALLSFSKTFFSLCIKIFKKDSPLKRKLFSFHEQLYFFRTNPMPFIKSMIYSLVIQILTPLAFFAAGKAFNLEISLIYFLILVPIIMTIAFIPVTIAGIGTREAAAVYFFSLIGVQKSIALGMSLLNLFFFIFTGILGGLFYVSVYHRWLQSRS